MSKNPVFDYTKFCLDGFIKTFPTLFLADPSDVAEWLYETVSAFSGRPRGDKGGTSDDLRCLVAAAAGIELSVCAARKIKDALSVKLRCAWLSNNHAMILYIARGFERAAATAVIDYRDIDWCDPYRVFMEEDDEGPEIPETIEKWVEIFCEPSQARSLIGNRSRKRLRRKPAKRAIKNLFEEI